MKSTADLKTRVYLCTIIATTLLSVIIRCFTYPIEEEKLLRKLAELNQAEAAKILSPDVTIEIYSLKREGDFSEGIIVHSDENIYARVRLTNSLCIVCHNTVLYGRAGDLIAMQPSAELYGQWDDNQSTIIFDTSKQYFYLNVGDQFPGYTLIFNQEIRAKPRFYGDPLIEPIYYESSNEHYVSVRAYWIGSHPLVSSKEMAIFMLLYVLCYWLFSRLYHQTKVKHTRENHSK